MKASTFCLLLVSLSCAALQGPSTAADPNNALQLLQQASRRYAEAKSYHIEKVSETTISTELSRKWQKAFVTASAAPENRYHYTVRSEAGNRQRISDGTTEWTYHVEEKAYTRQPAPIGGPASGPVMNAATLEEGKATQLLKDLAGLAGNYVSAESAPDEVLEFGSRHIPCYVVRLGAGSLKKPLAAGWRSETTVWIGKDDFAIRKIARRQHTPAMISVGLLEDMDTESAELYPVVELGGTITESEFAFSPPAGAGEVEEFSGFFSAGPGLQGKPAPAVTLKSAGGVETPLASLRGKPVLLDFWATWCEPCVAAMPQMAKLYRETKEKGLVFISVDRDHEASTAADFLAKKQEPWPNYHDDGDIGKAFHENGLPFTVLIDAQGKIVYAQSGYVSGLKELREAIAALGPEYASIKAP